MGTRLGSGSGDSPRSLFRERASAASDEDRAAVDDHGVSGGTKPEALDHRPSRHEGEGGRGDPTIGRDPYQDEGGEA
jgi:hypothetical protein